MQHVWSKFAKLLVDYCTAIKQLDEVLIASSYEAYPLIVELYKEIVKRGAYPRLVINDEVLNEIFYRYAPHQLLEYLSPIDKYTMENIDVRISILSSTHTKPLISIDPERRKIREKALKELREIFMKRESTGSLRWTVTAYPTRALAQESNMSPLEFEEFVIKAIKLHVEDPLAAWLEQAKKQQRIVEFLSKVDEIRILDSDTDLLLKVGGRTWINDDGKNNMPGGEVFTAPHEDSVEGYITFTYPAIYSGTEVEGIKLVFRRGEVVESKAMKGDEFLRKMLEVDEGAKRVGEFAFGLNYDINRFTKQILFDEKIGGTMHLALGASYLKTGGKNSSAIHWDMIKDLGKASVYADKELVYKNGKFIEEVL
uniref:Aminopeptidase n=1 Tax=Ignisphaera aggregans TaxID=334771 RepID=A0A7C2V9E2_9CREN